MVCKIGYGHLLYAMMCCRYQMSGNVSDWESSYVRMEKLDKYHGQASGVFGCDEHLAGTMPSRGTELCTVVETICSHTRHSLKFKETQYLVWCTVSYVLYNIIHCIIAERAEKIGYNALPATITPDMWAHQYLQQGNEMNAIPSDPHIWFSDGFNSTLSVHPTH